MLHEFIATRRALLITALGLIVFFASSSRLLSQSSVSEQAIDLLRLDLSNCPLPPVEQYEHDGPNEYKSRSITTKNYAGDTTTLKIIGRTDLRIWHGNLEGLNNVEVVERNFSYQVAYKSLAQVTVKDASLVLQCLRNQPCIQHIIKWQSKNPEVRRRASVPFGGTEEFCTEGCWGEVVTESRKLASMTLNFCDNEHAAEAKLSFDYLMHPEASAPIAPDPTKSEKEKEAPIIGILSGAPSR